MVAKKKKAAKKPMKSATRKPAKKLRKTGTPVDVTITFGCDQQNFCVPDQDPATIFQTKKVTLQVSNTDVDLLFDLASPFTNKAGFPKAIKLKQGSPQTFTVGKKSASFSYTIKCTAGCPTPSNNPEMIVP